MDQQLYSDSVGNYTLFAPSNAALAQALKLIGAYNDDLTQVKAGVFWPYQTVGQ